MELVGATRAVVLTARLALSKGAGRPGETPP